MNNKFLNKVVGQILSETKLNYEVETVAPPFLPMSLFGFSFFNYSPFSIHNIKQSQSQSKFDVTFYDIDIKIDLFKHKKVDKDIEYILIQNQMGDILAHTFGEKFPVGIKNINFLEPGQQFSIKYLITKKGKMLDIAVPILNGELGVARLGISAKSITESISEIAVTIIYIFIGVLLLGIMLAIFMAANLSRSVLELVGSFRKVSRGDLEHRVSIKSKDEIGQLAKEFNNMTDTFMKTTVRRNELIDEIVKHKKTEEILRQREEELKTIFNSTTDGILVADINGRTIHANQHFSEMWKIPEKLMILGDEEKMLDIVMEQLQDPQTFLSKVRALYKSSDSSFDSISFKDGRLFDRYSAPLIIDEKITGRVWNFRDVTERSHLENELNQAQKLESLGILAGGIAHDFNNLLQAIFFNVSLLKMSIEEGSEHFETFEETEKNILRAKGLTHQLLTFSKGGEPVKKRLFLSSFIKEAVKFSLSGSRISSRVLLAEGLWAVEADEGQINQVIQNLVINAVQSMPDGGDISLKAENVVVGNGEIPHLNEGRYVVIYIKDKGHGIAKEHLLNIFDPFFTTKEGGSGLGLSTVYSIINRHGGVVKAESILGKGTTFKIYIPASVKESVDKPKEDDMWFGEGRVLVMDDEKVIREQLARGLGVLGYKVETARDGMEAIKIYEKAKEKDSLFDVVVLDLTVPGGMGGMEALENLKQIDPELKAIVSSGYSNDPIMAKYRENGFEAALSKPYHLKELSKILYEVVNGSR